MAKGFSFKIQDFVDKTLEKVNANPEFQYHGADNPVGDSDGEGNLRKCYYIPSYGKPACLFGQVLTELGIPEDALRSYENRPVRELIETFVDESRVSARVDKLAVWANNIQTAQDRNYTWVSALDCSGRTP